MLKPNIELIRDLRPQVLLTWHKPDGRGGHIPIAIEYLEDVDAETRERIGALLLRPLNTKDGKGFPGSSKHFLELPRHLERLGFRVRTF